ncbi:MAG: MCE family protein [Solirubrobacterales bacterium]|nr:MCE family protein [Solirubrobacterales bacterium]
MGKSMERLLLEARRSLKSLGMLVGLILVAAITVVGIARNITFERPWEKYREVNVAFDDVKGIFPGGHQVRIHGVKVGVVSKSTLRNGRPELTLKIEDKWGPVYKDAKIQIRPVTPLQDLYVNIIDRGTKESGEAKEEDVIASANTITPVDISRVLNTFNAPTRQRMGILLTEMGRGLDDGGEKLKRSFVTLAPFLNVAERTTAVLATRKAAVKRVVTNFGELSAALAARDKDVEKFVQQGNIALGELARNDQPLAATLTGLDELLPVMRSSFGSVDRLTTRLDPALVSLKPVAANLEDALKGLQQVGDDARPAFSALRPAARSLRTMARTLPSTSKALQTSLQNLESQTPQFDRLTALAGPCMPATLRFFDNTLSVFKYSDVNGTFPRGNETVDLDAGTGLLGNPALNFRKLPNCTDGK